MSSRKLISEYIRHDSFSFNTVSEPKKIFLEKNIPAKYVIDHKFSKPEILALRLLCFLSFHNLIKCIEK